jgi:hypothetical protein
MLIERYLCEIDNFVKYLFTVRPSSGKFLVRNGTNVRTVIIPEVLCDLSSDYGRKREKIYVNNIENK